MAQQIKIKKKWSKKYFGQKKFGPKKTEAPKKKPAKKNWVLQITTYQRISPHYRISPQITTYRYIFSCQTNRGCKKPVTNTDTENNAALKTCPVISDVINNSLIFFISNMICC